MFAVTVGSFGTGGPPPLSCGTHDAGPATGSPVHHEESDDDDSAAEPGHEPTRSRRATRRPGRLRAAAAAGGDGVHGDPRPARPDARRRGARRRPLRPHRAPGNGTVLVRRRTAGARSSPCSPPACTHCAATTCSCRAAGARSVPATRSPRCSTRSPTATTRWAGCGSSPGSTAGSPPRAVLPRVHAVGAAHGSAARAPHGRDQHGPARLPPRGVRGRGVLPQRLLRVERDGRPPGGHRLRRRTRAGRDRGAAAAARASTTCPSSTAGEALLNGRAPWYRDWASRPDGERPVLGEHAARRGAGPGAGAGAARRRLAGPVPRPDPRRVRAPAPPRRRRRPDHRPVDTHRSDGQGGRHHRPGDPGLAGRAPRRPTGQAPAGPRPHPRRRCRRRVARPAGVAAARGRAGAVPAARRRAGSA